MSGGCANVKIQCLSNAFSHDALNILQPYFNLPTCAQGINSVRFINFIVRKHYFLTLCTDHATNVQTNLKIEGLYTLKTFAQMGLHSQRIFCFRHAPEVSDMFLAALAAIETLKAMQWRPICEAPTDGTHFLAYEKTGDGDYYECWWQIDTMQWEGWQNHYDNEPEPTHWKPLVPPTPPTQERTDG